MRARSLLAAAAAAVTILGAGSGVAARADVLVGGDTLSVLNGQSFDLGSVPCNTDGSKQLVVAISRSQGGTNSFASGSTVSLAAAGSTGVSVTPAPSSVSVPSTWKTSGGTTATKTFTATVHPTSAGAGSGSVTFTATGKNESNGSSLTLTSQVSLTWTGSGCVAQTSVAVNCPTSVTYTGAALEPCTATVSGGGLNQSLPVTYSKNTNAGTAGATASYAGDATHSPSSGGSSFAIAQAPSEVAISCANVTYDGSAQAPCSAEVTGAGGLKEPVNVVYPTDHTNAGQVAVSAHYPGDSNHLASNVATQTFTIGQASSTVAVTCTAASVSYTAQAQDACSARVSGAGALDLPVPVSYDDNTNVGTVTARASYDGDANHTGSNGLSTFSITAATSTVTITCEPAAQTFDNTPKTPCSARVTGPGLDGPVEVTYSDNVDAGTVKVKAVFAGDSNHSPSQAESTFTIAKALPSVTVTCLGAQTYDGSAQTPCAAHVTGPGSLDQALDVVYTDNVNAGLASAKAVYAGNDNYLSAQDTATFQIAKASSSMEVSCDPSTYNALAQEPCTGTVSGAGTIDPKVAVTYVYSDNTDAGTASVTASWPGDANHTNSSSSVGFQIARAASHITLKCTDVTFTGEDQGPCSGVVDGVGGVDPSVEITLTYSNNHDAGQGSVTATWDGDKNHLPSSKDGSFTIAKAASTVTLACTDATFDGTAQTPCTAGVTGAGGLYSSVAAAYPTDHTNAGKVDVSAQYAGDDNHFASDVATTTFQIAPASSNVNVKCTPTSTYTGDAQDLCAAEVTGAGSLKQGLPVKYDDNTNAGTVTATASFDGDRNHLGSTGSSTFSITAAGSVTTISCDSSTLIAYDGTAKTPCTATVTGVGGLLESVDVSYDDNVNAGEVSVTAAYAGDRNHDGSKATTNFTIARAKTSVAVVCSGSPTYTGSAQTPCSARVTGPGGLSQDLPVTYTDNMNAGTAAASASFAETRNYLGNEGSATFLIAKATSITTVTCPTNAQQYTGSPLRPCTAAVTGAGTIDASVQFTYLYTANTKAGTASVTAVWPGDSNHTDSSGTGSFTIAPWTLSGFDKPVDMSTSSTTVWNTVKGGSTVPLKFTASAYGRPITTVTELGATFAVTGVSCPGSSAVTATVEFTTTGGTELRYSSPQFIQNWQTPKTSGGCYKVTMTTADGSSLSAWFMTK